MPQTSNTTVILAFTAIVLAVIGAATFLANDAIFAAAEVGTLFTLILGAVGVTGAVHLTGQTIKAVNGAATPPVGETVTMTHSVTPVVATPVTETPPAPPA